MVLKAVAVVFSPNYIHFRTGKEAKMHSTFKKISLFVAFLLIAASATAQSADPLPRLAVDPSGVTVSGLSSGGFMAVQLHVAYSSTFKRGAGIVAGGPYYCSRGNFSNVGCCMIGCPTASTASLVKTTNMWSQDKSIDPVSDLRSSRVYLFSGTADKTVTPYVMNRLLDYYRNLVPAENILYRNDIPAGHAMITDDYGGECAATASPFINNCCFDLAGEILKHLYGNLAERNDGAPAGKLMEFDQTRFTAKSDLHKMAATGWVYIPMACEKGVCRLHVVLHGCKQNTDIIGKQFITKTGYNRWADTNNIVVLYPQTSEAALNGCWDWWGYTGADFAKKSGLQMAAIKAMVDRLSGKDRR
jgi:hypothetical protein